MISAATVVFFAALTGCGEDPSGTVPSEQPKAPAPVERMKDPSYTNALEQVRRAEVDLMRRQQTARANMERMVQRARDVLGTGATEAQAIAELDAHPGKYPGWRENKAQFAETEAEMKRQTARMREAVRARNLKEAAERKAAGTDK